MIVKNTVRGYVGMNTGSSPQGNGFDSRTNCKRTLSLIRRKSSTVEWLPVEGEDVGSSPAVSAKT